MQGRRYEHPHYTDAQVREHLTGACDLLREHGFDPVAHERLLVAVFDKLSAKQITVETVQPGIPGLSLPGMG